MSVATQEKLTIGELARDVGLPVHVLRRFLDRHGLIGNRAYPGQWRFVATEDVPAICEALQAKGYLRGRA